MKRLIHELKKLGYSFFSIECNNENFKKYVKYERRINKVFIIETNCNNEKIIDKYLTDCTIFKKEDLKLFELKFDELIKDYEIIKERINK